MVKDHGRAEDITQEVFVSALRRMRETERPIAFKPWIYEIAKNACIDAFRRSQARRGGLLRRRRGPRRRPTTAASSRAGPTPDAAVDAKQELDHLCGAFGGLSDTHHEILVLRELEGLSYREIGERLGHEPPGGREHALPRAPAPDRGVRRARLRRALPAHPGDHRRPPASGALGARDAAPPRPPRLALPAVPPRGDRRRARRRVAARATPRPPRDRARRRLPAAARLPARAASSRQRADGAAVSEPMAAAWSKAVAAARRACSSPASARAWPRTAAASRPRSSPTAPRPPPRTRAAPARPAARASGARWPCAPRKQAVVKSTSHTGGKRSASLGKSQRGSAPSSAGTPSAPATPRRRRDQAGRDEPHRLHAEPDARRPRAHRRRDPGRRTPSLPQVTLPKVETPASAPRRSAARSSRPSMT